MVRGVDSALPWQEHESKHFNFRYLADSPASMNITTITRRSEALLAAVADSLELASTPDEKIHISLADIPDDGGQSGDRQTQHPVVIPNSRQIRIYYGTDAPALGLEQAILRLLLTNSLGEGASQSTMIVDGVAGYVSLKTGQIDSAVLKQELIDVASEDGINLREFLHGPTPGLGAKYQRIVAGFVAFLIEIHGPKSFHVFAQNFDPDAVDRASVAAYNKRFRDLEREWLAYLRETKATIMGIGGFVVSSWPWLSTHGWILSFILLSLVINLGFITLLPLSYRFLIDRVIPPGDFSLLWATIGVLGGLFIVDSISTLGRNYATAVLETRVMKTMRTAMFAHLLELSLAFHGRSRVGDLLSRLSSDIATAQSAMTYALPLAFRIFLGLAVSGVLLLVLEWRLALVCFAALPIIVIGLRATGPAASRASYHVQKDKADLISHEQETISAQTMVKVLGLEDRAMGIFHARVSRLAKSAVRLSFVTSLLGTTSSVNSYLMRVLALGIGAFMVIDGELSLGTLVAFLALLENVTDPLEEIPDVVESIQRGSGGMQRTNELLAEKLDVIDASEAIELPRATQEIRLDHVGFSYTSDQVTLDGLSITLPVGRYFAFVGPSGCGKSTILNLIMRLYDPAAGSVSIDGVDIRQVSQSSLRAQMGTVLQDNVLFNLSIRENIRLGKPEATDEEVTAATQAAEIHDFILGLPRGYDTVVGERGGHLSGGQRQRLAIARAIIGDPAILLLDEATSALDPATERDINATLEHLSNGRTVLSITHRLSSVVMADHIFVIDRGKLVEEGPHEELLRLNGLYKNMWEQQAGFIVAEGSQYVGVEATRIQRIPIFENLTGPLLATLASHFFTERFAEAQVIFEEGDPGDKLYIVVRGTVEVITTGAAGQELILALLRDGDYFGEMALMEEVPRTATVRAKTPCTLLSLHREQFVNLLVGLPELRAAFERKVETRKRANAANRG